MNNHFYTAPEAAKICSVSRTTMWRWVKHGEIKGFRTPRGIHKIRKKDLESFIRKKMKHLQVDRLFQAKKILIVDDDKAIVEVLSQMLSFNGYQIEKAFDGFEAGVKITLFKPDLMILNLYMSGIDGFDVCRQIKSNPDTLHIKIMALTGFDTPENKNRIMKAGADGFLAKQVDKDELMQKIEDILND